MTTQTPQTHAWDRTRAHRHVRMSSLIGREQDWTTTLPQRQRRGTRTAENTSAQVIDQGSCTPRWVRWSPRAPAISTPGGSEGASPAGRDRHRHLLDPRGGGSHLKGSGPDAAPLPCAPAVAPRAEQDDRVIGQASEPRGPCLAGLVLPIGMTRLPPPTRRLLPLTGTRQGRSFNEMQRNTCGESNPHVAPDQGIRTGTPTTEHSPPQNHWSRHHETHRGATCLLLALRASR